jgi:chaperonin GroEL
MGGATATVLDSVIYTEGIKNVTAGCNPMDLHRGSLYHAVEFLHTKAVTSTTAEIA